MQDKGERKMENNNRNNQLQSQNNQVATPSFSQFMAKVGNKLVEATLTDTTRRTQFTANLMAAISNNPTLRECDQLSVVSAALQAESLKFPINNSLGYVYLVPFNDKKSGTKKAQFQIGYKGYIQLAIRSGQYKDINVVEVKDGELGEFDPLNGQKFNWIKDYEKRKAAKTIGYVGQLELMNGFKKQLYISYEEMLDHADTYSQAFSKNTYIQLQNGTYKGEAWKLSSFWYKAFDEMAKKTVLRQMLSKWGIMSIDMQDAYIKDQAEMKADGTYDYIDSTSREYKEDNTEAVRASQEASNASQVPPMEEEPQKETITQASDFDM